MTVVVFDRLPISLSFSVRLTKDPVLEGGEYGVDDGIDGGMDGADPVVPLDMTLRATRDLQTSLISLFSKSCARGMILSRSSAHTTSTRSSRYPTVRVKSQKNGGRGTHDECTTLLLLSARQILDRINNLYARVRIDIQRERIVRHCIQRSMYRRASYFYGDYWVEDAYGCFKGRETLVSVWEYAELTWLDAETNSGGDVFFCWAEPCVALGLGV